MHSDKPLSRVTNKNVSKTTAAHPHTNSHTQADYYVYYMRNMRIYILLERERERETETERVKKGRSL